LSHVKRVTQRTQVRNKRTGRSRRKRRSGQNARIEAGNPTGSLALHSLRWLRCCVGYQSKCRPKLMWKAVPN